MRTLRQFIAIRKRVAYRVGTSGGCASFTLTSWRKAPTGTSEGSIRQEALVFQTSSAMIADAIALPTWRSSST